MIWKCYDIKFSRQQIHTIEPPFRGVSYERLRSKVHDAYTSVELPPHRLCIEYQCCICDERYHWKYEIDLGNDDYGPYNLLQAALCDADQIFRGVISYDLNCSLWPADWTQDDIDNEQEMWAYSSMT
jgi:hypothetical protein